ncbi:MAG: hypothetical protein L0Z50_28890, partial [Verrucomicrobiales bacterium]|nr:hypothetical protein [Verrucomicrobiales bacterium]
RSDSLGDGVPDGARDFDHDGLSNAAEVLLKSDPTRTDSDYDGLSDGDERLRFGTDPFNPDTDGDGWPDGMEVSLTTNPQDEASKPSLRVSLATPHVSILNAAPEKGPGQRMVFSEVAAFENAPP